MYSLVASDTDGPSLYFTRVAKSDMAVKYATSFEDSPLGKLKPPSVTLGRGGDVIPTAS